MNDMYNEIALNAEHDERRRRLVAGHDGRRLRRERRAVAASTRLSTWVRRAVFAELHQQRLSLRRSNVLRA